jgi:hypothetical protein
MDCITVFLSDFTFLELKLEKREAGKMKKIFFYTLFVGVVGFGFVSCFASQFIEEKLLDVIEIESIISSNYQKSMEAREDMMDELLLYFEKNGAITKKLKTKKSSRNMSLEEKEERVNNYFDFFENSSITENEIKEIEIEVSKIGEKYETAFSGVNISIFESSKMIEGVSEDDENIIIGGDIILNKSIPENAAVIINLARKARGEKELNETEIKKRGFYCSQSSFMWHNSKWESGKVKYRMSSGVSSKEEEIILGCMKKWEEASEGKIKFVRYRNSFWNRFRWKFFLSRHVQISVNKNISNSWATLGEQVRAQLNIDGEYFAKRTDGSFIFDKEVIESEILHEIGHILTLFHEHQRADRDEYISINYERAAIVNSWSKEKAVSQYGKITMYDHRVTDEYDYESIMHYWSSQSDEDGNRDIVKKNGNTIPRAMELSKWDKAFIKELYRE